MNRLPDETLLRIFQNLNRFDLDGVQICCRRFNSIVQNNAARLHLRTINEVEYTGTKESQHSSEETLVAKADGNRRISIDLRKELDRGIKSLSHSFVKIFTVIGHNRSLPDPTVLRAPGMLIYSFTFHNCDFRLAGCDALNKVVFGCKFLQLFIEHCKVPANQISDKLLQKLAASGINLLEITANPPINPMEKFKMSEAGIINYCFKEDIMGKPRTLALTEVSVTPMFMQKCIQACKSSTITSTAELLITNLEENMLAGEYGEFVGYDISFNPTFDLPDIREGMRVKVVMLANNNDMGPTIMLGGDEDELYSFWLRFGKKTDKQFFDKMTVGP
ncbi:hypothetical protein DdX_17311 [Ditylenchus destructor]|uniref:F-box domain-containing protein n=1 Tax=Ditylenchus destructor TaxID=166010 RepID=A0AAD4MN15_9BILA|nr:hypothetical protein DdX_17311 [Ditylenchus destructor]